MDGTPMFRGVRSTGSVELGRRTVGGMRIIDRAQMWPDGLEPVVRESQMAKIQGPMSRILARVYRQVNEEKPETIGNRT